MPGRPNPDEFRHPDDDLRRHFDKHTVDPRSRLHVMTLVAAEQQTMNFYMAAGNIPTDPIARGLYLEIAMIEEQHVTQYESLLDPLETWFEQWLHHEYLEVWLYHSFMEQETDPRVKAIWELHLNMEIGQLQVAADMLRRYDGKDAALLLPATLPPAMTFEPNKAYVRQVLAEQVGYRADGLDIEDRDGKPSAASAHYQATVNADGNYSQDVIDLHGEAFGTDYRLQTDGDHPVDHRSSTASASSGNGSR
jgi:hypothetical protein